MTGLVQIHDVARAEPDPRVRAFSIDRPRPDADDAGGRPTWALEFDGWALGSERPLLAVEVVPVGLEQDPDSRWRIPLGEQRPDVAAAHPDAEDAKQSGFYRAIGVLALPRHFELQIQAVLGDGARAPLAAVRGSRAPLPTGGRRTPSPVIVTAAAGADARPLLELLATHPGVVAVPPSEGDTHAAAFWVDVLRALSEPASYMRQVTHARNLRDPGWWLGREGPSPRRIRDEVLQTWMGTEGIEALIRFAQDRIERFYRELGRETDKRSATRFAELVQPTVATLLLRELYPDCREVVVAPASGEPPAASAPDALVVESELLTGRPTEALAATLEHAGLDTARGGVSAPEKR